MPEPRDMSDTDLLRLAKEQRALLGQLRYEVRLRGPDDPLAAQGDRAVAITLEICERVHAEMRNRTRLYREVAEALGDELGAKGE